MIARRAPFSWGALAVLLCATVPAAAQHAGDYDHVLDEAVAEFAQAHFVEARALFERAHAIEPTSRTLRGIGMTEFELRHYARALGLLRQALVDERKPLTDELRAKTEELAQRTETFVARFRPSFEPASAVLEIDGAKPTLQGDGTLWLDAGEHTLRLSAEGFATHDQKLDARGGSEQALSIQLSPVTPAAVPESTPQPHAQPAARPALVPAVDDGRAPADVNAGPGAWPWIVVGVSGALLLGGGAFELLAQTHIAKVEDAKKGSDYDAVRGAHDAAPVESAVGFAMLGVGAAGVVAGLVWALSGGSGERDMQAVRAAWGPSGVTLAGRF